MSDLGRELREWRAHKGLTLRKVAERAGVSHVHVGDIERGAKGVSGATLRRVVRAIGFTESRALSMWMSEHRRRLEREWEEGRDE